MIEKGDIQIHDDGTVLFLMTIDLPIGHDFEVEHKRVWILDPSATRAVRLDRENRS